MKKYLIFTLTLTAALSGIWSFAPPASAAGVYGDLEYWDIEELAGMKEEVDAKVAERCADEKDDPMCVEFAFYDLREEDEKYEAYNVYANARMYIASIRPDQKTIKFVYRNYDPWAARTMGVYEYNDLDSLFIIRYEEGAPVGDYVKAIRSGTADPQIHIAYALDTNGHSANWFKPNQEIELTLDDFEISPGIENAFWFTSLYGNTGTGDYVDFSGCINSPDYKEGTECKLVYNRERYFFLPSETIARDKAEQRAATNPTNESTKSGTEENHPETAPQTDGRGSSANASGIDTGNTSSVSSADGTGNASGAENTTTIVYVNERTDAPETLATTSSTSDNAVAATSDTASLSSAENTYPVPLGGEEKTYSCVADFPWWFIALVVACDVVIMWFFWPKKREN